MATRTIRTREDDVLRKRSREIQTIDERVIQLAQDMIETMYEADGVGLAAPQIGILKRIVVIDVGEGPITLINPEIIEKEGSQTDMEGCLSIPGVNGYVTRPMKVKARAFNEKGQMIEVTGEGLLARAICHEIDHLEGVLFTDHVEEYVE